MMIDAEENKARLKVVATGPLLSSETDATDLLGDAFATGALIVVVPAERLDPRFFDLSTRLAGDFIQKLQNYNRRLFVVGDISGHLAASKALRDFVGETNRIGHHGFVPDRTALEQALS